MPLLFPLILSASLRCPQSAPCLLSDSADKSNEKSATARPAIFEIKANEETNTEMCGRKGETLMLLATSRGYLK